MKKIKYVCPDCGKSWRGDIPETCDVCGCPSSLFNKKETESSVSPSTQHPSLNTDDEEAVRNGMDVFYGFSILLAVFCVILGIVAFCESGFILGVVAIVLGLLIWYVGWVNRAFFRLFANMSERLTSIDNKLKKTK